MRQAVCFSALRAFVWVICVGCERVRVVVSEGKALWRYWWHAGTFVYDFRTAAPKGVAGRVSISRLDAEPSRAVRCGTQTRIPERLSSPGIAAYGPPENTVALGFVEGLNNTCALPPLPRDHHA